MKWKRTQHSCNCTYDMGENGNVLFINCVKYKLLLFTFGFTDIFLLSYIAENDTKLFIVKFKELKPLSFKYFEYISLKYFQLYDSKISCEMRGLRQFIYYILFNP